MLPTNTPKPAGQAGSTEGWGGQIGEISSIVEGNDRTIGEKATVSRLQAGGLECHATARRQAHSRAPPPARRGRRAGAEERRRSGPRGRGLHHRLDPEVLRVLTLRKVVDYWRRRGRLARGDYTIEVIEGRTRRCHAGATGGEICHRRAGGRLNSPLRRTQVGPWATSSRGGRGGFHIELCELEEFDGTWNSDQVRTDAFGRETAGRRELSVTEIPDLPRGRRGSRTLGPGGVTDREGGGTRF